jgi:cytochrome bd-type quinol oxidase subunit 2
MLLEASSAAIREKRGGRRSPYRTQVAGVLAAAFSLSLAYSAIVTFTGSHEGYGMGDPVLWAFYAVGFGLAALTLTDKTWAWWVVAATVLILIAVGIFYYPTIFPPSAQTAFAWFENDVYLGLLILAEYLCVLRLRGIDLTAGMRMPREATTGSRGRRREDV